MPVIHLRHTTKREEGSNVEAGGQMKMAKVEMRDGMFGHSEHFKNIQHLGH